MNGVPRAGTPEQGRTLITTRLAKWAKSHRNGRDKSGIGSKLSFLLEQCFQVRERPVSRLLLTTGTRCAGAGRMKMPLVLVFVAVSTEQFPVAAVGGIVVVIVVAMMNFEQLHVGASEFPRTAAANPGIHLERELAVTPGPLLAGSPRLGDDPVEAGVIRSRFLRHHRVIDIGRVTSPAALRR